MERIWIFFARSGRPVFGESNMTKMFSAGRAVLFSVPVFLSLATVAWAQEEGAKPAGLPVEAVTVESRPLVRAIRAVGSLRASESVIIRPETDGRIVAFDFTEGQPVAKGAELVRLDASMQKAELAAAEASLALSGANYRRAQELAKRSNVSEAAREEAYARMRIDQASVNLAQAGLAKTVISAPFDGIIGLRQVSVGAYITPGQDIVDLQNIDPIKVDFRVPEAMADQLSVGQPVSVDVDAMPGRSFDGKVFAIDPTVDVNGRSLLMRAELPNTDGLMRPGMFARVALVLENKPDALMVPEQALVPSGKAQMVVKVIDGAAQYLPVRIGQRKDGMVEIVEGLSVGDVVVTAGQLKLRPGAPVMVLPPKTGG